MVSVVTIRATDLPFQRPDCAYYDIPCIANTDGEVGEQGGSDVGHGSDRAKVKGHFGTRAKAPVIGLLDQVIGSIRRPRAVESLVGGRMTSLISDGPYFSGSRYVQRASR